MYVCEKDTSELATWIRKELVLDGVLSKGSRGVAVKRVQEWLNLRGFGIAIDSQFGEATASAVQQFQEREGLAASGSVDEATYAALVQPMRSVVQQRLTESISLQAAVLEYAEAHLREHPLEVGGQNRGPWVRLYMKGSEGASWAWCAGFVTFVLNQAAESLAVSLPFDGSFSCDSLAAQGKAAGLFRAARDLTPSSDLPGGSVFLVRRTSTDWTHTGLVKAAFATTFSTIEGNTNDDGDREGFEVCSRSRAYKDKDFILLS